MTNIDPAFQQYIDKQAIRDTVMRYFRGTDRCDADLIESAYHPDAVDERPGKSYTGEGIGAEIVKSLQTGMKVTNHQITTQVIEVHGDTAACESYCSGTHLRVDDCRMRVLGRYLDRLERRNGEWKIIRRGVVFDSIEVFPPSEDGLSGRSAARRDRSDPSYALFEA